MRKGKVLVIGSNATEIEVQGGGTRKIGQYLNETVVPIWAVQDAGYETVLATPKGTQPHLDETALSAEHFGGDEATFRRAQKFFAEDPSMTRVLTLRKAIDAGLEDYAAIFVPGGHAPVVDLMFDSDVGEILHYFHDRKKPTAMICPRADRHCCSDAECARLPRRPRYTRYSESWRTGEGLAIRWIQDDHLLEQRVETGRGSTLPRQDDLPCGRRTEDCGRHREQRSGFPAVRRRGPRAHHRPEPALRPYGGGCFGSRIGPFSYLDVNS
jgi:putative intracellular protease/amidase